MRDVLLTVTHLRPFLCTLSLTLLPERLVGVTLPFAVTRLPSFRAPLLRPLSLSVTVGATGGAVTVKLLALAALPPGVSA